jgi:hypothetical protein
MLAGAVVTCAPQPASPLCKLLKAVIAMRIIRDHGNTLT